MIIGIPSDTMIVVQGQLTITILLHEMSLLHLHFDKKLLQMSIFVTRINTVDHHHVKDVVKMIELRETIINEVVVTFVAVVA